MTDIRYVSAWGQDDGGRAADAKAFWTGLKLLRPERAEARVKDLCSMAYADGKLIGLTTVELGDYPPFRARFAFFRCAVAPDFRRHYLATFLTRHTLTIMEAWSLANPQDNIQGIAAIFQAQELSSKAVYPQWADWNIHLNLAGYTERDEQVRVAWFRHARLA